MNHSKGVASIEATEAIASVENKNIIKLMDKHNTLRYNYKL
jgi:hypothetical protein